MMMAVATMSQAIFQECCLAIRPLAHAGWPGRLCPPPTPYMATPSLRIRLIWYSTPSISEGATSLTILRSVI